MDDDRDPRNGRDDYAGAVTATFTFDETVTGFESGDISVTNAAVSSFAADTAGTVWTATITPDVNGTPVTVDVAAEAAADLAGNASTAATQASVNYTVALGAPVGFTATAGNTQVTLSWSAPAASASAGTAAVQKYQYRHQAGSGVSSGWTDVADGADNGNSAGDETSVTVTGLTNGTRYTFELRAVNAAGNGSAAEAAATPTAVDGSQGVTVSAANLALTELHAGDAERTYTLVLDSDPGAGVAVTVTSNDDSAVRVDTDSRTPGDQDIVTFTSGNWNVAQTVTVRAVNDGDAANETVIVSHTAAVASDSGNPYHRIRIADVTVTAADAGHGVRVSAAGLSVFEGGGRAGYTLSLKSDPGGTLEVTPASDTVADAVVSGALTFTSGDWRTAQIVTVTGRRTGSATISHTVTAPTAAYPANTVIDPVAVSVVADGAAPRPGITFIETGGETVVREHDGTAAKDHYRIVLNTAPTDDVTVTVTAGEGLRVAGAGSAGFGKTVTLTFTPGGRSLWSIPQTVTVSAANDLIDNENTRRTVDIAHATDSADGSYRQADAGTLGVTVIDYLAAGAVISPTRLTVGENSGTAAYTVELASRPLSDVVITVTSDDVTLVKLDGPDPASAYTGTEGLIFTPSNWNVAQTVTLEGQDDNIVNRSARTATVTHTIGSAAHGDGSRYIPGIAMDDVNVVLADDEADAVYVSIVRTGEARITECTPGDSREGCGIAFSVSLSRPLVGGERADIELTLSGEGVRAGDFSDLAPVAGAGLNTGVRLQRAGTVRPTVIFAGAGARVATLKFDAIDRQLETPAEETLTVAVADAATLAADPNTNLGGETLTPAPGAGEFDVTVVDDEHLVTFSESAYAVSEGAGAATVTLGLSRAMDWDVSVNLGFEDGTATSGQDYGEAWVFPQFATIEKGETSIDLEIPIVDDSLVENTEFLTVLVQQDALPAGYAQARATVRITDNEPTVSISSDAPSVFEGEPAVFTITRNAVTSDALSVNVNVAEAGAVDTIDTNDERSHPVTIAANRASASLSIPTVDNSAMAGGGGVTATLGDPDVAGAYFKADPDSTTVAVEDNDTAGITVTPVRVAVREADDPNTASVHEHRATYRVRLNAPPDGTVTVTPNGVAGAVAVSPASLVFTSSDWDNARTVTVTGVPDAGENPGRRRTVTVTHAVNASGNYAGVTAAAVTVDVADREPVLSMTGGRVAEGDSGTADLVFTLTLSPASERTVTVQAAVSHADGDTGETDCVCAGVATISFAPGETGKSLTVPVVGDILAEGDETLALKLLDPVNAVFADGGDSLIATGVIVDDDGPGPVLSMTGGRVDEGDSGTSGLTFTVSLSAPSGDTVTVDYGDSAGGGSATRGVDYAAVTAGTLTFEPGVISKTLMVKVIGDLDVESDETVALYLSDPANAVFADARSTIVARGVIHDNDTGKPVLSVTGANVAEGDSGTAELTFTVTLSAASADPVTVDYASSDDDDTAASGTDYAAVSGGTLTLTPGVTRMTVTVDVIADDLAEDDETVALVFSDPAGAVFPAGGNALVARGTIVDDDYDIEVSIRRTGAAVVEEGTSDNDIEGGTIEFTVSLSRALGAAERVDVPLVISGTGVEADDFAALALAHGETLNTGVQLRNRRTLGPVVVFSGAGARTATLELGPDDRKLETPQREDVTVAVGGNAALAAQRRTTVTDLARHPVDNSFDVTVVDDEHLMSFADADRRVHVPEGAQGVKLKISQSRALLRDSTFRLSYSDDVRSQSIGPDTVGSPGSTTSGEDYRPAFEWPEYATIEAGETSATVAFELIDDTERESVERVRIELRPYHEPEGFAPYELRDVMDVYIVDNDNHLGGDGVTLSAGGLSVTEGGAAGTYTVVLNTDPVEDVTVTVSVPASHQDALTVQASGATAGASATLTFTGSGTGIWSTAQTVTVSALEDADTVSESVSLVHSAVVADTGNPYHGIAIDPVTVTVTDNDTAPGAGVSIVETDGGTAVGEDGTADTYTVVLNTRPASDVTVTVTAGAGARVNQSGGTAGAVQTLTFSPTGGNLWSTAQTVTVSGVNDDIDNAGDARAAVITHSASSGDNSYTITNAGKVSVSVGDDDTAAVTVSETSRQVAENGGTATYTVRLESEPLSDVAVTVTSDDRTAVTLDGPDAATAYTDSESLTFTPSNWSATQTVTLRGEDDNFPRPGGRTATVTHEIRTGKGDGGRYTPDTPSIASVTVTVADDDAPSGSIQVMQSGGSISVSEDGTATDSYAIRLWTRPAHDVTVTVSAEPGVLVNRAGGGAGASETLTFTPGGEGAWNVWQTVTVTGRNDDIDNADDRRLITVSHATGSDDDDFNNADAGDVIVSVTDDDTAGVTVSQAARTLAEDGATGTYTVVLDTEPLSDVVITVTSDDDTAVRLDGPDAASAYTGTENLTFTPSNWNVAQTVTLEAQDDDVVNSPDRTATITHEIASADNGDGSRYTPQSPDIPGVAVTVTNDDRHALTLSLASLSGDEGDSGTRDIDVVVAKPAGSPEVSYSLCLSGDAGLDANGTQAAGEDYRIIDIDGTGTVTTFGTGAAAGCVGAQGTVTFARNVHSHTYRIRVFGETDIENDEKVIVTLRESASAALPTTFEISDVGNPATHVIRDDDTPYGLRFTESGGSTTVSEDGAGTADSYDIELLNEPAHSVTVTVTAGAGARVNKSGGSVAGSQTLTFTTSDWNVTQTITVTGTEDEIDNAGDARTVLIGHSTSSTDANYEIADAGSVGVTVTDNDTAGVTIAETGGTAVNEDGSDSDTYTVVLDTEPIENVTLTVTAGTGAKVNVDSGTAGTAKTLTFTPSGNGIWSTPQTVTVTGTDDAIDNPGARAVIIGHAASSTDPNYVIADAGDVSVTVTDDDATTVTLARSGSGVIAENGGTVDVTITLGRTLVAGESVTVPLTVTGATVATHYTLALKGGGTGATLDTTAPHNAQNPAVKLSGAGARIATLTVTAVDNNDEMARTVAIAYGTNDGTNDRRPSSTGLSGGITTTGSASIPIIDDDAMISVAAASAAEGSAVVFTVTLPEVAPSGGVTVDYSTSDGRGNNADASYRVATGADYTAAAQNAMLSIAQGARSGTVSISTTDDSTYEGDHYFTLTLDRASHFNLSSTAGSAIGTITDAADTPSFAFSAASTDVDEDDGTVTLTVEKTGTTLVAATVSYATTDGTAAGGSDFTVIAATDLTFATGDTSKDVTVSLTDDSGDEPEESFTVDLTAGADATLGGTDSHSITITDNDATTVTLSAPSGDISESGGSRIITVRLGRALVQGEELGASLTFGGTASFGADYALSAPGVVPTGVSYENLASDNPATKPPTVKFTGGPGSSATATVTLSAGADRIDEGSSETVTVGLADLDGNSGTNLDGGASESGTSAFNITDDDDAGVNIDPQNVSLREDRTTTFKVKLNSQPTHDTTVTLTSSDPTIAQLSASPRGASVTLAFTPENWNEARTVTVHGISDGEFQITVTIVSADPKYAAASAVPTPLESKVIGVSTVRISGGGTVKEGESATFTLTADPVPAVDVPVRIRVDYSGGNWSRLLKDGEEGERTVTIPANSSSVKFQVHSREDDVHSRPSPIYVYILEDDAYDREAGTGTEIASMTVLNDDPPPPADITVSLKAPDRVTEGGTIGLKVVASKAPESDMTVYLMVYADSRDCCRFTFGPSLTSPDVRRLHLDSEGDEIGPTELGSKKIDSTFYSPSVVIAAGQREAELNIEVNEDSRSQGPSELTVLVWSSPQGVYDKAPPPAYRAGIWIMDNDRVKDWWPELGNSGRVRALYGEGLSSQAYQERVAAVSVSYSDLAVDVRRLADAAAREVTGHGDYWTLPDWWNSLDCRKRRIAVGAGNVADAASPWCRSWDALEWENQQVAGKIGRALTGRYLNELARTWGLHVEDARVTEGPGAALEFTVSLKRNQHNFDVYALYETRDGTARAGLDYEQMSGRLHFAPGETVKTIRVPVLDDAHDEGSETMTLRLFRASTNLLRASATGTIVNTDAMPQAWLARFGRAVAEQVAEAVSNRFEAPRTPGLQSKVAGAAVEGESGSRYEPPAGMDRFGHDQYHDQDSIFEEDETQDEPRRMTLREAVMQSEFTWNEDAYIKDDGSYSLWGRFSETSFNGADSGISIDGKVTTGFIGLDFAHLQNDWLAGAAVALSEGEGGYTVEGGTNGDVTTTLTAVVPYAHIRIDETRTAWGLLGIGGGDLQLKPSDGETLETDIDWQMLAGGITDELIEPQDGRGFKLSAKSDVLWTRTTSKAIAGLKGAQGSVARIRLGLEAEHEMQLGSGSILTSTFELGARHDSGDAETGWGTEAGLGVAWHDESKGLKAEFQGRGVVDHDDSSFQSRGYSVSVAYDLTSKNEQGLTVSLSQVVGSPTSGGMESLFGSGPIAETGEATASADANWNLQAAYGGYLLDGGVGYKAELGYGWSQTSRELTLGGTFAPGARIGSSNHTYSLKYSRKESYDVEPEYSIEFQFSIKW